MILNLILIHFRLYTVIPPIYEFRSVFYDFKTFSRSVDPWIGFRKINMVMWFGIKIFFFEKWKLSKDFLKLITLSTGQSVPISAVAATISCLRCYFDKIFNNDWIKGSSSSSTWYFVLDIRIIQWLDVATCVSEITKMSRDC